MKYRSLGNSGISVSEIGFGTWGIGGTQGGANAYGATNDADSKSALERSLELGINFYDTSDLYGFGHAETLLGEVFSSRRTSVVIASKGGFISFDGKQDFSRLHLSQALNSSLKRLKTDYIDLYQLHSPLFEEMNEDVFEILDSFKKEGKVRAIGVSVRSPEEGIKFLEKYHFDAMQVNFNFVDQRALELDLIGKCRNKNVGVIVRTPLAFGFLTGKYVNENNFPEGDHRRKWSKEQRDIWSEGSKIFTESLVQKTKQSPAQIALRFCLSFKGISSAIPGMLISEHVEENHKGGDLGSFTEEELNDFRAIYSGKSFFAK